MDESRREHETHGEMEELRNPDVRFERQDVNEKFLTRFGIGMILAGIVALSGVWLLFNYLVQEEKKLGPPPSAGLGVDARKLPPEPRLQPAPVLDLREMQAAEDAILNHYSWIDPDKGVVRIPIARAMDLMLQRGFPVRQNAGVPAAPEGPTDSGLGPVMQQPGGPLAVQRGQ
jgi:hypothetical protein